MGPKIPQYLRFIGFVFTTATLLAKYILRIFKMRSGKVKGPPVSQFDFRVRHSIKITDHMVLYFNTTFLYGCCILGY
jgi:hypothetical protein